MQHRDNATHEARMLYEEQRDRETLRDRMTEDTERRARP
jgi:hypothetical protein